MKTPGNVVLVANNFPPIRGGSAIVYDNLARYAGGRVIVIAPRINYTDGLPMIGWREHDRRAPYRVIRLKQLRTVIRPPAQRGVVNRLLFHAADLMIRVRVVACLFWLIMREPIQAVCIGELLASGWLIPLLNRFFSIRTMAYIHGEEITTEDSYDQRHERARRALQAVDRIVVVSHFTMHAVRELVGGADNKIRLVENGVDSTRFLPLGKRPELLELYQLQDRFVFISVCRLLEKKGVDYAIQAFASVVREFPDCRLLVVGTGPYGQSLLDVARQAGVADSVIFAGDVPDSDLAEHYNLGDVFIMPNRQLPNGDTEGFGLVFLEANSCGIPVIAGRDGGSRDAVRHGVNGLVVEGGSIDEIAAAMLKLRTDPALRETLRQGGLRIVEEAGWDRKAELFLRLSSG